MRRSRDDSSPRVAAAVVAVTAAALLARLWALGWRVAHQDEARVADWTLQYMDLGAWQYRPIIHGPFLPHVNGVVFDVFGATDFTMRLVVAVVGGLLPLTAWLYRTRLSDVEVGALAVLLAANPVVLYYSRFMRNDLLLAGFMFTAVGLFVRFLDTHRARYLYASAVPFALAFTTKENSLLYPLCWLGALALVTDDRMAVAGATDTSRLAVARRAAARIRHRAWRAKAALAGSALTAAVIVVSFYAPKPDLYRLFEQPGRAPAVLEAATIGTYHEFADLWASTSTVAHSYVAFLSHDLSVLVACGTVVSVAAVVGYLANRYATETPRPLVSFAFYWGVFSVLGYPAVVDIAAAWTAVNALVPLAIPAAVGVGAVVRYGRRGAAAGDTAAVRLAVTVLVVSAAGMGAVAAETTYAHPQSPSNPLVQYAQPGGTMQPTIDDIQRAATATSGLDVLYYGDSNDTADDGLEFSDAGDGTFNLTTGPPSGWHDRLPFPWYLSQVGANATTVQTAAEVPDTPPPVVISVVSEEDDFAALLAAADNSHYERHTYPRYLTDGHNTLVIYVDTTAVPAAQQ